MSPHVQMAEAALAFANHAARVAAEQQTRAWPLWSMSGREQLEIFEARGVEAVDLVTALEVAGRRSST